jgi:hypothetical protein
LWETTQKVSEDQNSEDQNQLLKMLKILQAKDL